MARKDAERRGPRVDGDLLTECGVVDDEAEITDAVVQGDFAGSELHLVGFRQCRVESATFTASRLIRAAFVDCVVIDSDLSGVLLEDGRLERVEFHRCRLSGLQAPKSHSAAISSFPRHLPCSRR